MIRAPHFLNLAVFVVLLYFAWTNPSLLSHTIFHDDSFYYFKIAENYIAGLGFSFSGETQTTGFHPLWMYILVCFGQISALLFGAGNILLVSLFASFILATCFIEVNKKTLMSACDVSIVPVLNIILFLFCYRFIYDGMESGLVLVLVSVGYLAVIRKNMFLLGFALALLVWARIDLFQIIAVFGIALSCYFLLLARQPNHRPALTYQVVFMVGLVLMSVIVRYQIFPMQNSSAVKGFWFQLVLEESSSLDLFVLLAKRLVASAAQIWWPIDIAAQGWFLNSNNSLPRLLAAFLGVSTIAVFLFSIIRTFYKNQEFTSKWNLGVIALISVIYITVHGFYGSMSPNWQWYLAFPTFALLYVFFVSFEEEILMMTKNRKFRHLLSVILLINLANYIFVISHVREDQWRYVYNSMLLELKNSVPTGAVVGTWAAGHIGYFAENRIVNLEGLVEDDSVLAATRSDDISELINDFQIEYILIKKSPSQISEAINLAASGEGMSRHNLRSRVFKDLDWKVVSHKHADSPAEFSLIKVEASKNMPGQETMGAAIQ